MRKCCGNNIYLGNYSATEPWHSRHMSCENCEVCWEGCWDNFQCPKCGEGELPTHTGGLIHG